MHMYIDNLDNLKNIVSDKLNIYVWGAGEFGKKSINLLQSENIMPKKIIDNDKNKWGKTLKDIEIISFKEFDNYQEEKFIIICSYFYKEIEEQLKENNFKNYLVLPYIDLDFRIFYEENIKRFEKMTANLDETSRDIFRSIIDFRLTGNENFIKQSEYPQYFHPIVSPKREDVIIDGGAFIGDSMEMFNSALNSNCIVHSFEPTTQNFSKLVKTVEEKNFNNIIFNNLGLGEKSEIVEISFDQFNPAGSKIMKDGGQTIKIISIDEYVVEKQLDKIDLIKLDVEGFELATLKGAIATINKFRPKLQVCLYHKKEDLIDIYEYLSEEHKELNYKFFVGHHSDTVWETVLYAISY